ncbi:MAG: DUF4125 family protein [Anaerovoracaceae bacterium]
MNVIAKIIAMEWEQFQKVQGQNGRAACQEDPKGFVVNRLAQFLTWDEITLEGYCRDLENAVAEGRNLMTEKYARMMRDTQPQEYGKLCEFLPEIESVRVMLVEKIISIQTIWQKEFMERYPMIANGSRPLSSSKNNPDSTGFRTYLRSELYTLSERTLRNYLAHIKDLQAQGRNMTIENLEYVAKLYGFKSLQEMENLSVKH